jgi:hypothetical protein
MDSHQLSKYVISWSRLLLDKLILPNVSRNAFNLIESENSPSSSQEPATFPEPSQINPTYTFYTSQYFPPSRPRYTKWLLSSTSPPNKERSSYFYFLFIYYSNKFIFTAKDCHSSINFTQPRVKYYECNSLVC